MALLNRAVRRLGSTLSAGLSSREGLRALPGELGQLGSRAWRRLSRRRGPVLPPDELAALRRLFDGAGIAVLKLKLDQRFRVPERRAAALSELSRDCRVGAPQQAVELARAALALAATSGHAKWLAFRLHDVGAISEPARLLEALPSTEFTSSEARRRAEILAQQHLQEALPGWEEREHPAHEPQPDVLLYVAAMALPYHSSGYATRTQSLALALQAAGIQVTVLTRPGYPWDRKDSNALPTGSETLVDGVRYLHFRRPSREMPLEDYVRAAAEVVKATARRLRAARIHAASNHLNALPALVAARELGLPFTFEMRGLWELTRASGVPGYAGSERYELNMALERHCALHADEVSVISQEVGRQARAWGVDAERVTLLPNCVDAVASADAAPVARNAGSLQLAYAGSVLAYEGLELLVAALARLRAEGLDLRLTVAGDGAAFAALQDTVRAAALGDAVRLLGRVTPAEAAALLASCDAVALPRLPMPVCEAVPPIKLVEAMALGKPVVVPDLAAFRDEVEDGVSGLLFRAGDVDSLAAALRRLAADPALATRLGEAARTRVNQARTWKGFAQAIADSLARGRTLPAPLLASATRLTAAQDTFQLNDLPAMLQLAEHRDDKALGERAMKSGGKMSRPARAGLLLRYGKALGQAGHLHAEGMLAGMALQQDGSEVTLRGVFWASQRARLFEEALEVASRLEALYGPDPIPEQRDMLAKLARSPVQQLRVMSLIDTPPVDPPEPVAGRVAYVLHNSLPYSSGGYGTRSHGVACGLQAAGHEVIALTRPGFPLDIKPELTAADVAPETFIDGIRYVRTLEPLRSGRTLSDYVTLSADAIEAQLRHWRPAFVVAASNHLTALPALIAARRLGLPFCYEVRGLWEITRMSRDADFETSSAYTVQRLLEARVASSAEHVFTLTEPMREELIARGVASERIDLLPNSCDPARFEPRSRDEALTARLGIPPGVPVIGYIGTFVDYEGLEDLAAACALLKARGLAFRLMLVGNENASGQERGPITAQIIEVATAAGMQDWLLLPGRVPHDEVESYYSLIDVAPFPRKPWPVCEMVSPMKPLEALAMQKAVLVSNVRALAEMISDDVTGLQFQKGDVGSLADALQRLLGDPALRTRLGVAGRDWVVADRTWDAVGRKLSKVLLGLSAPAIAVTA